MAQASKAPDAGMLVRVRARRWLVEEVVPGGNVAEATLVRLAGVDDDNRERSATVLWEKELDAEPLESEGWEAVARNGFDEPDLFAAFVRTLRWNTVTAADPRLFQAPFRAGIRLEAYQLEPLVKALRLPRVNLLIADDVGLGKTIEAALIMRELILRKRVDRFVVAVPPSMLIQWQEELERRFGLDFVILDRLFLRDLRRTRGFAVNPWTTHSRFLISHRLLTDDGYVQGLRDVLGDFAPKSMFVLDEAHHAAPASGRRFAIDSQFTRAVRDLARRFEHRLFLTATPHNGHSNSFSALLEILDPDRFCRGVPVRKSDLEPIAVRRLKEDLRALGPFAGSFPERKVEEIEIKDLPDDHPQLLLPSLLAQYRSCVESRLSGSPRRKRAAALLAVGTLQYRLLSSIEAFARTLERHRRSVEHAHAELRRELSEKAQRTFSEMILPPDADSAAESEAEDGEEASQDAQLEAFERLSAFGFAEVKALDNEISLLEQMARIAEQHRHGGDPRIDWLLDWIDRRMCPGFRDDPRAARWTGERLILFTEWEDTRRWLERKLRTALEPVDPCQERIAVFTGLTSSDKREAIKHAFNEPPERNPIRILICTDAAREGLNLQRHCNQLVHFDLPWNPGRIEQRNGRIDRKLQPRDTVYCRYFRFVQRPEDRVLSVLVRKTETIREELGSLSPVLANRISRQLQQGIARDRIDGLVREIDGANVTDPAVVAEEFEDPRDAIERERRRAKLKERLEQLQRNLERSRNLLRIESSKLCNTLGTSLRRFYGATPLTEAGRERSTDGNTIDLFALPDTDRLASDRRLAQLIGKLQGEDGAIKPLTFDDPDRLGEDVEQLHLEHPLVRRLLARFQAQDLIEHHLRRACLLSCDGTIPRVVLLGRLTLFASGAARLHEEIVPVVARWSEPGSTGRPLRPLRRTAETDVLDELERAFDEARPPAAGILERMAASAAQDVAELLPHLRERARGLAESVRARLAELGEREATDLARILENMGRRIAARLDMRQQELDFDLAERRQIDAERREQRRRLASIERDIEERPARIRQHYEVRAVRLEPVGIVYLWPREMQP
ncbi:MAG TPA: helicase [Rhodospirillales bacterium]|nr:helicase [Rhodospirillales bacterium]